MKLEFRHWPRNDLLSRLDTRHLCPVDFTKFGACWGPAFLPGGRRWNARRPTPITPMIADLTGALRGGLPSERPLYRPLFHEPSRVRKLVLIPMPLSLDGPFGRDLRPELHRIGLCSPLYWGIWGQNAFKRRSSALQVTMRAPSFVF